MSFLIFLWALRHRPGTMETVRHEAWYGNWPGVLLASGLFGVFLLGFLRPRRRAEWKNAGMATAFLISLFAEMFGVPLTIYLLASALRVPPQVFGLEESHLWAYLLDRLGVMPLAWGVYAVMVTSVGLIVGGVSLMALGWHRVYQGRGTLVTDGIYGRLRHPQYLGLILLVVGFNIQWPTVLTLAMAPVLIVMYVRLARREDQELAIRFGDGFTAYASRVPAFWLRAHSSGGRTLAASTRGPVERSALEAADGENLR
ncbi:MAG: methyltransferase family protein [Candidatus Methylomirabilales bacterium]